MLVAVVVPMDLITVTNFGCFLKRLQGPDQIDEETAARE